MGCGGEGARKNAALVAMSCLTLINEGADTGRICESRGGARGPRAPEAEGRGWQREGHGHRSTPSGKGQRGKSWAQRHQRQGWAWEEVQVLGICWAEGWRVPAPELRAWAGSPPAHTRLLPASQALCPLPVQGVGRVSPE